MTSRQRYPRGIKGQEALEHAVPPSRRPEPLREQGGCSHSAFLLLPILGPWAPHTPAQTCTRGRGPDTQREPRGPAHCASGLERRLQGCWAGHCLWVAVTVVATQRGGDGSQSGQRSAGCLRHNKGAGTPRPGPPRPPRPLTCFQLHTHRRQLLREASYGVFKELVYGPED